MDTVFHFTTKCFRSLPQIHLICAAVNYINVIGLRLINKGESADMVGNKSFLETEGGSFLAEKNPHIYEIDAFEFHSPLRQKCPVCTLTSRLINT